MRRETLPLYRSLDGRKRKDSARTQGSDQLAGKTLVTGTYTPERSGSRSHDRLLLALQTYSVERARSTYRCPRSPDEQAASPYR
jgi:hypothetical protein